MVSIGEPDELVVFYGVTKSDAYLGSKTPILSKAIRGKVCHNKTDAGINIGSQFFVAFKIIDKKRSNACHKGVVAFLPRITDIAFHSIRQACITGEFLKHLVPGYKEGHELSLDGKRSAPRLTDESFMP